MRAIPLRAAAIVAACAIVAGVAACGDSDDGDNAGAKEQSAPANASLAATRAGDDKEQITATLVYVGRTLEAGDGEAFCAKLSQAGRDQYVTGMRAWGRRGGCAEILSQAAALSRRAGLRLPPVTVASVTVRGDKAVAKSRGGVAGRSGDTLGLVKVGDEWKLSDLALGGLATN